MAFNGSTTVTECAISSEKDKLPSSNKYKVQIVWRNVIVFVYLHLAAVYGIYLAIFYANWLTVILGAVLYPFNALGIGAGVHRLWSHKAYKARLPLKIFLAAMNTMAFQNSIYVWCRDHRLHHKYSETDADPHNATRGFFFSHVGWLLCRKHPEVKEKGKGIDMSDLERDPVVMFQHKYYFILMPIGCFLVPTIAPMYFWNESISNAWHVCTILRYVLGLNNTWLVNSAAHLYGNKPYDKHINPSQNLGVSIGTLGEGWHNYHHVFPWDYKAAELGSYKTNIATLFIDMMAKIGMAYDCKTVPDDVIRRRVKRTGDGSHPWGWGDKDITEEERNAATILYRPEQLAWGSEDRDLQVERNAVETIFKSA